MEGSRIYAVHRMRDRNRDSEAFVCTPVTASDER